MADANDNIEKLHLCDRGNPRFFVAHVDTPIKADDNAVRHLTRMCRARVLERLSREFGIDISDAALRRAVNEHNEVCRLVNEIGACRKLERPTITGYEYAVICLATYCCPKNLLLPLLRETAEELKTREPDEKPEYRVRVVLAGSEVDDPDFVRLIEQAGALVVADRYCFGSFPGREQIELNDTEDVLTQICRHTVMHCQCPRYMDKARIDDRRYQKPAFAVAAPEYLEDDLIREYGADEVKAAIRFVEEQTGEKWDWDAYFANMRLFNEQTRSFLEILEMQKTAYPQVPENNYALHRDVYYTRMMNAQSAEYLAVDDKLRKLMMKGYERRELMCREPRHRALMWGVQAEFYTNFPNWLMACWGIVPITHFMNLTSTEIYADTDTPENREQAYYDIAHLMMNMVMRNRSEGGFRYGVDDVWRFCEEYHCDMIILYEQIACKALTGYHGIYEEEAMKRGLHLVWVTHSLLDPRKAARQNMRDEVNRYMRTVLNEEPLDPALEEIEDQNAW